ncbi:uncharacterized protein LOC108116739 isoform X2 [Drosophila eugracilis]|uniref:uncharacterized protein LOC108116739 isoform X2 n=1 Tax=Drosophila eugracilis TaxID=29029 RepID=UPI0007E60D84|nr:uncharacterized protein LOC108116739 isoform X2 [Drosophila eugracilis]
MESDRELPTDDALMELEGFEPWDNVKSSASLVTLKRSLSQETITPPGDEVDNQIELSPDAIHLGLLVEKGLIEYDSLDMPTDEDEVDDYSELLSRSTDRGGIAEIVKEMRNEFMVKLSSKAKSVKEILIQPTEDSADQIFESELKDKVTKDDPEESEFMDHSVNDEETNLQLEVVDRNDEISGLISKINQFTSGMEKDPDSVDWGQFRANLLKVHRYYVSTGDQEKHILPGLADIYSAPESADISKPLKDISSRARYLRGTIRGLECKMLNLDNSFDVFCDQFDRSSISNKRVDRDVVVLSMMRDGIGLRLSQLEVEFRSAKEQLFNRGLSPENQSDLIAPSNN